MKYHSKLFEDAVNAFSALPGIGKRSATRLVLFFLDRPPEEAQVFTNAISNLVNEIKHCRTCHNISDHDICPICSDTKRDQSTVCIVENVRDVMAIEETNQYKGTYHILGGIISPIEGIGPDQLHIDSLIQRIEKGHIKEIVMAISPTIEGETTIYFLAKKLADFPLEISTIARGVSFGGELEYADELTLGRSILARTPYSISND